MVEGIFITYAEIKYNEYEYTFDGKKYKDTVNADSNLPKRRPNTKNIKIISSFFVDTRIGILSPSKKT